MAGRVGRPSALAAFTLLIALVVGSLPSSTRASSPATGTLTDPPGVSGSSTVSWTGGPYTVATPDPALCVESSVNCDTYALNLNIPANYWDTHDGKVTVAISWASNSNDFDLNIRDSKGAIVGKS